MRAGLLLTLCGSVKSDKELLHAIVDERHLVIRHESARMIKDACVSSLDLVLPVSERYGLTASSCPSRCGAWASWVWGRGVSGCGERKLSQAGGLTSS